MKFLDLDSFYFDCHRFDCTFHKCCLNRSDSTWEIDLGIDPDTLLGRVEVVPMGIGLGEIGLEEIDQPFDPGKLFDQAFDPADSSNLGKLFGLDRKFGQDMLFVPGMLFLVQDMVSSVDQDTVDYWHLDKVDEELLIS